MKIFLAGHRGMVGQALHKLLNKPTNKVITAERAQLDLCNQQQVANFFCEHPFDQVYLAAAKVGGILANNNYPAEFIYQNLMIQNNVIHQAWRSGVTQLLLLGSSCIYPKHAAQPMSENELLNGKLEPTNEPYAIAKIAGIKMCESYNRQYGTDFRTVMPTNLYGPNDNFHPSNSHVIPALMRRFHEAKINNEKTVTVWGSGRAKREFLHVDDMAHACVHVMNLSSETLDTVSNPMQRHINIGTGIDCSISQLAEHIAQTTGYKGQITYDSSKPDGTPRKLLNVDKLTSLGWQASISLETGLQNTYRWFLAQADTYRT